MIIATTTRRLCGLFVTGWLVAQSTGCAPPPATDQQDLLDTIRNGTVGAEVRRLDDAANAYVRDLFKADHRWSAASAKAEALLNLDSFWARDAAEWRDIEKAKERHQTLGRWLTDEPVELDEGKPKVTRREVLAEFDQALTADPGVPGTSAADLAPQVKELLNPHASEAAMAPTIKQYHELLTLVMENAGGFEPGKSGLAFTDPAVAAKAEALWTGLHAQFTADREALVASVADRLSAGKAKQEALVKEKQDLLATRPTAEADQRKLRRLELEIKYYDAVIKSAEAAKKRLAQKAE